MRETNSLSSSWTNTGVLPSTEITSTTSEFIAAHQLPSSSATPPVSADNLVTGSHTFRFERYSQRKGLGVGKYLASDTFKAGGYDWAITLYPNGKKDQYNEYISLYIMLVSKETDVYALFELMLVDQSGKGQHRIHEFCRGDEKPSLMKHRGSQWGFHQFTKKKYLEKLGYLKDDCLVVNCVVGVLQFHKNKESQSSIGFISNYLSSSMGDQITNITSPLQLNGLIKDGDHVEFDHQLYAVEEIQPSIRSGTISSSHVQGIYAMKTLQAVFRGILDISISMNNSNGMTFTPYSSSTTSNYSFELQGGNHAGHGELSSEQIHRLRSIIERLNSAGCLGDCIEVYIISRKAAVDARFLRFGIGAWSINDFRSPHWVESVAKIKLWIRAAHDFYFSVFPGERKNYEQIFYGVGVVTYDNCFLAIAKHVATELNNFAEAVTTTPASFQKLFDILDLYKAMLVILPEIEKTFHTISSADISHGATKTIDSLATLIRKLFFSFEDTVLNEQSNTPLPKEITHSLTRYAMDYLTSISMYKEALADIIVSKPTKHMGYAMDYLTSISMYKEALADIIVSKPTKHMGDLADERFLEVSGRTPLGLHLIWIIKSLTINLEGKSSFYGDSSSRYVFIINNVNYIINTIKGSSELLEMIGKDCPLKLSIYVLQAAEKYFSSTWDRVLYCLRDEGLNYKFPFYNSILKNALKNRFKTFNTTFEEVCQTQSTRFVPDIKLRGRLHKLILSKLIPAYKSFLDKFGSHMRSERYIKYSPEDLEDRVQNFALGTMKVTMTKQRKM